MIVGGGTISFYLARLLLASGIQVKIIERNRSRCEELSSLLPDASIIYGDGSDQDILEEERLDQMDSFVALTGFDEENILLSLLAQNRIRSKIVTKINRKHFSGIVKHLSLESVINPKDITS